MGKLGFRDNGSPYVYEEIDSVSSAAIGLDAGDSGKLKIVVATNPNATPGGTPLQMTIDPSTNGNIIFTPNGAGAVEVGNGNVQIDAGSLTLPNTTADGVQGIIYQGGNLTMSNLGNNNFFIGNFSGNLTLNTGSASSNTAVGSSVMYSLDTGFNNVQCGGGGMGNLTTGHNNTGLGTGALASVVSGSNNIAVGFVAGQNYAAAEDSNIVIGNFGTLGDNHTIRIGTQGTSFGEQNACNIAGIYGVTPGGGGLSMVVIDNTGLLGSQAIPSFAGITITGDSGGPLGPATSFTFTGGSTGLTFAGAGTTETLGGTLAIANGGTNATSMANADGVVYYDGTRLVTTAAGTATNVLTSNGAGLAPTFQAVPASSISITGNSGGALTGNAFTFTGGTTGLTFSGAGTTETLTGTLAIANGGTNATSMANTDGVVYYDGTRLVTTTAGTATQVLTSNGAGVAPTFQPVASASISITGDSGGALTGSSFTFTGGSTGLTFSGSGTTETLTGTLAIANGGTNATSMTNTDGVVYYDGTRLVTTTVGTATQVLTSNGAGVAPTFQAAPASLLPWTDETGATVALAVNNGYVMNRSSLITATLPATAAEGALIAIVGKGTGGYTIAQNSGQTIHFGSSNTTTGTGGSLSSSAQYDCVELICITANTDFVVRSSIGNLTVV